MKVKITALIIFSLFVLVSCEYGPVKKVSKEEIIGSESSSFHVDNAETGTYMFSIPPYYKNTGYTYYASIGNHSAVDSEYISFTVKKISGSDNVSYGIMFLKEGSNNVPSFITCMINTEGQYFISSFKNEENTYLVPKKESSALKKGLNQENIISVSFNKDSKEYTVLLNGESVYTGTYDKDDITGLKYGIITSVPAFDSNEERIEFKESSL